MHTAFQVIAVAVLIVGMVLETMLIIDIRKMDKERKSIHENK
jgi:hypothetical protein